MRVLIHEAGHAFQVYASRNQPFVDYMWATAETAEIHSMAMEFLTWPWLEKYFGKEADRYRYMHTATSFAFLAYGACVDHSKNPKPPQRNANSNGWSWNPSISPLGITTT